jgi:hypothetical protein
MMTMALTGLEFLVAFLQAYVFAVLTCMYLNDALHPATDHSPAAAARKSSGHPIPFQRSSIMEAEAAKFIGAGIACLGMGGAGIGLGNDLRQLPVGRPAQSVGS